MQHHHLQSTPILNSQHPLIRQFTQEIFAQIPPNQRAFLQLAHQTLSQRLSPVYTLRERQPASVTLKRGRGSCSQRIAVLEAVARCAGIPTRSRALWIDGQFWLPRFPHLRYFLPKRILLAWPEFFLDGSWIDFSELYGSLHQLAKRHQQGFTNTTGETLFEAVSRTAVDWYGQTTCSTTGGACDLSGYIITNDGLFPSRDAVFNHYGLFIHQPTGCLFELAFSGRPA